MLMSKDANELYEFGPFRLDVSEQLLLKNQEPLPLTPKVFETLVALVRRSGRLVEKEELLNEVWPDSFVEESNLTRNISLLRKALNEDSDKIRYIETVPRRGYRFVADVRRLMKEDAEIISQESTQAHAPVEEETRSEKSEAPVAPAARLAPALRYCQSLSRYLVALSVLPCLVLVYYLWLPRKHAGPPAAISSPSSIAVLPFTVLGAETNDELLGLGMADATIIKLSSLHKLKVLPTSAIYAYTERERDPQALGRRLGVDVVLEGTVQREGERVRVTLQLLNVRDGGMLWSGKFDERFTDIFTMQDSISQKVALALSLQLTGGERELLAKRLTNNMDAYQAYLMGIFHWNKRTKESLYKSIEYFQQALEKDSNYALAHAMLADAYVLIATYNHPPLTPQESWERARAAATRSLEIDETTAEAHIAMAMVKRIYEHDFIGALRSHQRALALNPSYATGHLRYGWLLALHGRLNEALTEMRRAQELDPLSTATNEALGNVLYFSRQYDEAIHYYRRALEFAPDAHVWRRNLAEAYAVKGMYHEAINEFEKMTEHNKDAAVPLDGIVYAYAVAGKKKEARVWLAKLQKQRLTKNIRPLDMAIVCAAMEEKDLAFRWLNKIPANEVSPLTLRYEPMLDPLRADPRFKEYLQRSHLTNLLVQTNY
jgi:DNA-binding winged helix-turn-helix (wHTH) protein/TolB-like protein/Tfp pilus assembly protein PilF